MSAVNRKTSESKYVTCFADSRPDLDITFRDVLLARPTDHYLVGIDNFSMTNTSLSMVDSTGVPLIRIVKIPLTNHVARADTDADVVNRFGMNHGTGQISALQIGNGFDLSIGTSDEPILSVQQLMHKLGILAADVNRALNGGIMNGANVGLTTYGGGYTPSLNETFEHLKFELGTDGKITVVGSGAFWFCFAIEIPSVQNQFGFYGKRLPAEIVDHTKQRRFMMVNLGANGGPTPVFDRIQVSSTNQTNYASWNTVLNTAADYNIGTGDLAKEYIAVVMFASIYSTLDRRIALEVGCSLPIKNSPMIDHQKESPDFVLGRWIWRTDPRIESNDSGGSRRYHSNMPACTEYQGAQDRITYHELQPQAKIQTLRIKLFARVRTFNEKDESWGMRVIALPTESTDWWHARIHFISKD